ncbi:MAG: hypothetical protein HUU30_17115 [Burkholderiaceae bacterium]|jgi:hypothetical protein|nr:hypothetical protein [Burkholderiaceae bacterium]
MAIREARNLDATLRRGFDVQFPSLCAKHGFSLEHAATGLHTLRVVLSEARIDADRPRPLDEIRLVVSGELRNPTGAMQWFFSAPLPKPTADQAENDQAFLVFATEMLGRIRRDGVAKD